MQRADGRAGGHLLVGLERRGAGVVGQHHHHRIERRIDRLDAGQMGLDHLL